MNHLERVQTLIDTFRGSGLRWTPQRQAIIDALFGLRNHPTAEEIFASVRRLHPGMSRATVYNTMEALASMGRIATINAADGTRRYDPNPAPHHHLRCRVCGAIFDVNPPLDVPAPQIPAGEAHGFRVESVQVEYHGICSACDRAIPHDPSQAHSMTKKPGTTRTTRTRS